ncbi:unnamed protein product [Caenorhabditis angaria]|uniref:Uncharacterized protein n=1 Tax=Caenorhabditis angaria TaxID=860376 RepID=A0A9P1ICK9_9PELO|nr:unnamed protein product [Caenorhabditis angaria]
MFFLISIPCFLNNIIMFSILSISMIFQCAKKAAFESDARVVLVDPASSKKCANSTRIESPKCVVPPSNVPISPMVKEEKTLELVKSIRSDHQELKYTNTNTDTKK